MRWLVFPGCVFVMLVSAPPALAELPVAVRTMFGAGLGAGRHAGTVTGPLAGILALDVAWRDRPGHEFVLSGETAGVGTPNSAYIPEARALSSVEHAALLIGIERSPAGSGVHPYLQGGIGMGWVRSSLAGGGWSAADRAEAQHRVWGAALGATAGIKLIPDPGPLGFLLAIRTSHVIAHETSGHAVALMFGLTMHPR